MYVSLITRKLETSNLDGLLSVNVQWKYYVNGRGREAEWKCQPDRYMSRHLVWDQVKWGCLGLMVTNFVSAVVATYVSCGGYCKVYMEFGRYPWWWWMLQWPVIFLQQVGAQPVRVFLCVLYGLPAHRLEIIKFVRTRCTGRGERRENKTKRLKTLNS